MVVMPTPGSWLRAVLALGQHTARPAHSRSRRAWLSVHTVTPIDLSVRYTYEGCVATGGAHLSKGCQQPRIDPECINTRSILRANRLGAKTTVSSKPNIIDLDETQHVIEIAFASVVRWSLYQFHSRLMEDVQVSIDRSIISILTRLMAVGPLRISELADYLGLDRSTLSRQVAATVEAGYAVRVPDETDARAYMLVMTESGRQTILTVRRSRDRLIADITSLMTDAEKSLVAKALPVLAKALERLPEVRGGSVAVKPDEAVGRWE